MKRFLKTAQLIIFFNFGKFYLEVFSMTVLYFEIKQILPIYDMNVFIHFRKITKK